VRSPLLREGICGDCQTTTIVSNSQLMLRPRAGAVRFCRHVVGPSTSSSWSAVAPRFFAAAAQDKRPRLVILGTGWGSFRVLSDIDSSKYEISVVSPRNHLLFTPMLASSALGTVNQRSICQPVRPIVAKKKAQYFESMVKSIDKDKKLLHAETAAGTKYTIEYDKLVIGVGFQPNDFNIPGVKENALFMKETADATVFKDHVLEKMEEAAYWHALDSDMRVSAEEEEKIRELLTFVVVGGGPTGVELTGELTDFLHNEGAKMYPLLKKYITVHMFTYDILNTFDAELQNHALKHLKNKQKVNLHLEVFVTKVTKDKVSLKKKEGDEFTIRYGTLVWCAGVKRHDFVTDFHFPMNERKTQILVDNAMKVKGETDIYALGDCCTNEDYWLPQTAQVANQQGQFIAASLNGTGGDCFVFHSKGMMAYLGGFSAVMSHLPGIKSVTGFVAFLGWRFTYWFLQLSARNRFMLATDWFRTLAFGRDLTRFGPRSKPT